MLESMIFRTTAASQTSGWFIKNIIIEHIMDITENKAFWPSRISRPQSITIIRDMMDSCTQSMIPMMEILVSGYEISHTAHEKSTGPPVGFQKHCGRTSWTYCIFICKKASNLKDKSFCIHIMKYFHDLFLKRVLSSNRLFMIKCRQL